MSFTPSGSSHLRKEQRRGWHGNRNLGWDLSGETGLEWQVVEGCREEGRREGVLRKKPLLGLTSIRAHVTNSYP